MTAGFVIFVCLSGLAGLAAAFAGLAAFAGFAGLSAIFGRPVFSAGTAAKAAANALSSSVASSAMPARSSSLFFAGRPSSAERCFNRTSPACSAAGMV